MFLRRDRNNISEERGGSGSLLNLKGNFPLFLKIFVKANRKYFSVVSQMPGECGGVLEWEGTARLADLTLLFLTGELGGMEREGDLLFLPPGEESGVGPRDIETPSHVPMSSLEILCFGNA